MTTEDFRWLGGVIAAHTDRTVVGRTRLQKEIMLLQRLGLPTTYRYSMHFHGPYSDGIQADVGLLESLGLVREEPVGSSTGSVYYVIKARADASLPQIEPFKGLIDVMEREDATVLEVAATYDAFRVGSNHEDALSRLRTKKGWKCDGGREEKALALLRSFNLPAS